ncbi:MAG: ABC transporter ATP-binding protein [Deferrisomatales bacterium]|nr:ABC transporter ATP-binding protein [Deferrisomatales bacterium]
MISVADVAKTFPDASGNPRTVLDGVSFSVAAGSFCAILGPSGCGKTTLLRIIAGVEKPDLGEVRIARDPGPGALGFVHQQNDLLPWMTAADNIEVALRVQGYSRKTRCGLAHEYLEKVGLASFDRHYPWQLSGGMQKRVSLARAMAMGAAVLLLDEPLAFLDFQTKKGLQQLITDLHLQHQQTILYVTHDIDEALSLSHKVIVLSGQPATVRTVVDVPWHDPGAGVWGEFPRRFPCLVEEIKEMLADEDGSTRDADGRPRLVGSI